MITNFHILKKEMDQVRTNKKHRGKNTCEYIILHHTATGPGTKNGLLNALERPEYAASYHYLIDENGDITKINKDEDILRHAGVSERDGKENMNKYSIGIEVIGPPFTKSQNTACAKLIPELIKQHGIPANAVLRHAHVSPGRKRDIAPSFYEQYGSREDYTELLYDLSIIMGFYEQIRTNENGDKEIKDRIFQDPQGAFERMKKLSTEDRQKEMIYLMGILVERVALQNKKTS